MLSDKIKDIIVGIIAAVQIHLIIKSIVEDLFTPLLSAIAGYWKFDNLHFFVNNSIFIYGHFLNVFITFWLNALVVYFCFMRRRLAPFLTPCKSCESSIPVNATRCRYCSAAQIESC